MDFIVNFFISVILWKHESFLFKGISSMKFCDFNRSEKFSWFSSFSVYVYGFQFNCMFPVLQPIFVTFNFWVLSLIFNYHATNILAGSNAREEKRNENTNVYSSINLYLLSNLFLIASENCENEYSLWNWIMLCDLRFLNAFKSFCIH